MPQRRRFATTTELAELLREREPDVDWPRALETLAAVGVSTDALVRIVVDEEV